MWNVLFTAKCCHVNIKLLVANSFVFLLYKILLIINTSYVHTENVINNHLPHI